MTWFNDFVYLLKTGDFSMLAIRAHFRFPIIWNKFVVKLKTFPSGGGQI